MENILQNTTLCQNVVEKNLTEPLMKSENKLVLGQDDFMHEIKIDSTGKEWIDIGKAKRWIKRCPKCGRITWALYKCLLKQIDGKMCKKCSLTIRNKSENMRKSVSESKKGKLNHFYGLTGDKNPARRPEVRKKLSEYNNRPEIKEKNRRVYVDMMDRKRYPGGQFYNKNACEFMDRWGSENGYKFEHALNGKEFNVASYWVDGYDKEKNVVFEYDEKHHYHKRGVIRLKPRDIKRMNTIQKELK
jgi:hypothetical protein